MKKVLYLGQYRAVVNENSTDYQIVVRDQRKVVSKKMARVKVVQEQTQKRKKMKILKR